VISKSLGDFNLLTADLNLHVAPPLVLAADAAGVDAPVAYVVADTPLKNPGIVSIRFSGLLTKSG